MFQSLASYFYGSTSENDNHPDSSSSNNINNGGGISTSTGAPSLELVASAQLDKNAQPVERTLRLVTKPCDEHDDADEAEVSDWLLVDKEESPSQTDSEDEIPFVRIKNIPAVPQQQQQQQQQLQVQPRGRHSRQHSAGAGTHDGLLNLSPASLLPSSMDESWFVTPPPCFTSVGPVRMETSPFENLLIEHPSMSVYHSMRASQTAAGDDGDDEDLIMVNISATTTGNGRQSQQQLARYSLVISPSPQQPQQQHPLPADLHPAAERSPSHTVRVRDEGAGRPNVSHRTIMKQLLGSGQKNHHHKPTSVARNALERGNKVREVNSKGGRQKRSDMNHSKVLSRANNNRKC